MLFVGGACTLYVGIKAVGDVSIAIGHCTVLLFNVMGVWKDADTVVESTGMVENMPLQLLERAAHSQMMLVQFTPVPARLAMASALALAATVQF